MTDDYPIDAVEADGDSGVDGMSLDQADEPTSAGYQRRLDRARSAVSDASVRARQAARSRTGRAAGADGETDPGLNWGGVVDNLQAYRTYIIGAIVAVLGLLVAVRSRRSDSNVSDDGIDLGQWYLRAEPGDE